MAPTSSLPVRVFPSFFLSCPTPLPELWLHLTRRWRQSFTWTPKFCVCWSLGPLTLDLSPISDPQHTHTVQPTEFSAAFGTCLTLHYQSLWSWFPSVRNVFHRYCVAPFFTSSCLFLMSPSWPWLGSSTGSSVVLIHQGCMFVSIQDSCKNQPMTASICGTTNLFLSLFLYLSLPLLLPLNKLTN